MNRLAELELELQLAVCHLPIALAGFDSIEALVAYTHRMKAETEEQLRRVMQTLGVKPQDMARLLSREGCHPLMGDD